jgi:ribosomal-protein-alanine N-acetyltransferase
MTNLGVEWIEVGSRIVIWPLSRPSYVPAPPDLIGPRVYLRPPAFADYRIWANLRDASRDFLVPWEPTWPDDSLTRSAYRDRVDRQVKEWRQDLGYAFHVFRRDDDQLLGGINFSNVRRAAAQACNLGYWMGAAFAHQGLMTEALKLLLPHAFEGLGLHRIDAACIPDNLPSRRLLLKFGFQEVGVAKGYLKINGAWRDHVLHCLRAEDLKKSPEMRT